MTGRENGERAVPDPLINVEKMQTAAGRPPRFLIAAGGTSGHINPAMAIAEQIRSRYPDALIHFVGTARGLESTLVPKAGYPFTAIPARGFPTRLSKAMFLAIRDYRAGRHQSRDLIRQLKPDIVIGTGGYVCGPAVAAAASLGVPVVLHEQNAFPGRANRFLARKSKLVLISFPGTEKYFPAGTHIILTGNPVRAAFFGIDRQKARAALDLPSGQPVVLILGGSLGARTLNEATLAAAAEPALAHCRLILACGQQHAEAIAIAGAAYANLTVKSYIDNIQDYMAAADLIVCRAGAITCAEVAALGRPSIMVPYPHAAGDHQTANAKAFSEREASILCPDALFTGEFLTARLLTLLNDPALLDRMGKAAATLARPQAAEEITGHIFGLLS